AAKVKAEADAKAKEEAAEKKANPARIWIQVATGANARALATDYGKFAKKSPDVFKGKSGATVEWGKTRRLLVGPFKDRKAAQDWLASYKKAGGDGFLFNSEAGQSVDPIK
ncbi:MAG: SPOR domain-containing protein, partial [Sphingopyxis sp.]|nr:SPOR domain-containing protein [Sphingopyxis sp.]